MDRRRPLEGHGGIVLAALATVVLIGAMLILDLTCSIVLLLVLALPVYFLSFRAGRAIRRWFLRSFVSEP